MSQNQKDVKAKTTGGVSDAPKTVKRRPNQVNKGMWQTLGLEYRDEQTFHTEVLQLPGSKGVIQRETVYNGSDVVAVALLHVPSIHVRLVKDKETGEERPTYNAGTMNTVPGLGRR